MDIGTPFFRTSQPPEELRAQLKAWEPWSVRIDFENGVSTSEFVHRKPFSAHPLSKFRLAEKAIPFPDLAGGRLLDIGCNAGYNSLYAGTKYRLRPVGIDVNSRHIEVSKFLAGLASVEGEFLLGDAEEFVRPGEFDVVLHFGTLYHLQNPLRALKTSFLNLRAGGYLALETQVYDHPDDANICYFMHMQNNDPTNFWALSTHVLETALHLLGYSDVSVVKRNILPDLTEHMSRILLVAHKPPEMVEESALIQGSS